jgi:hypothetical protein
MAIRLLILAVIIVFGLLFLVEDPDGNTTLTIDDVVDVVKELQNSTSDILPKDLQNFRSPSVTKVYKWKDENGVWQFSNTPVDEPGVEVIELDGQINTIPAFEPPESRQDDSKE